MNKNLKNEHPLDSEKNLGGALLFNKKILSGIIIFFIIVLLGFIKINIINTKALSPTGEGDNNYEIISNEFGEDFEEFINDGAEIKIYAPTEEEEKITVKIVDKEVYINNDNTFLNKFKEAGQSAYNKISKITDKVMDKLNINDKNNIEDNNKSNEKDDLDKIVDEFIKDME